MIFSLFVQASEGSTFGIVPYLNVGVTGTVSGIVGAGGNAGAVIFSILFRQLVDYRTAFFWMGVSTAVMSLLSSFVWIRGYEGLFFKRRVFPRAKASDQQVNNSLEPIGEVCTQNQSNPSGRRGSRSLPLTDPEIPSIGS